MQSSEQKYTKYTTHRTQYTSIMPYLNSGSITQPVTQN